MEPSEPKSIKSVLDIILGSEASMCRLFNFTLNLSNQNASY